MHKILVTDGRSLASLAIIRSLGQKGFEIHCGDEFKYNLSSFSKYVTKKVIYPSPEKFPEEFMTYLKKLNEDEKYNMIIPVRDETTLLLAKNKNNFPQSTNIYLADYDIILKFRNKGEAIKLAQEYGIPVPKTYFPEDIDIQEIKNFTNYPILIRPRISSGSRGIKYVASPSDFDDAYNEIKKEYGEPMIQEYVSHAGGHYSIGSLFDENSNPVAVHVYKEIKQYPISGGPAVVALSVEKEPWVDKLLELLEKVGWKGPSHMDVLLDPITNAPKLLEVNPRFWMSLNLSINSGVDFPYLLYQLGNKDSICIEPYKTGIKYRWVFPNEILWLTQTPNKIKGLKQFLNFWDRTTCYSSLSLDDPMASFGVFCQCISFLSNSESRKLMFKRGLKDCTHIENKPENSDMYVEY